MILLIITKREMIKTGLESGSVLVWKKHQKFSQTTREFIDHAKKCLKHISWHVKWVLDIYNSVYYNVGVQRKDTCFLCTVPCKESMPQRRRMGRAASREEGHFPARFLNEYTEESI